MYEASKPFKIGLKNDLIGMAVAVAVIAGTVQSSAAQTEARRTKRLAELSDPQRLFARGGPCVRRGEFLEAVRLPVGGVGAGSIHMDGRCRRAAWQLWRNFTDFPLPHSLFAVRARVGDASPVVRVLQTVSEGPLRGMKAVSFRGEYPFGWYTFEDPELPVQVSLEAFSPLIPLDEKNSAIPCAIFNLTVENQGEQAVEVSFLATQQNAAGLLKTLPPKPADGRRLVTRRPSENWTVKGRRSDQYGGNCNKVLRADGATLLHMTTNRPKDSPGYGEMVLAVMEEHAQATASWNTLESLCDEFAGSGGVSRPEEAGPSPQGETLDGALAAPFVVQPGGKRTVSFVLTWYFPNIPQVRDDQCPNWKHDGHMYANWWPDGLAVARYVAARLSELTEQTRRYHDSFYASNLPYWLLDRISSQAAILRSQTCFWAKDGFFGCWEGCSWTYGSCPGNATHVWGYAQTVPRLVPLLGRAMREQEHQEII